MLPYISLVTSALTALALASPHPAPAQLAQRDFASCQQDGLVACCLYASPSLASPYCASVLQTSTITAPAVTLSTTTTSTSVVTTTGTRTITVVSTSVSATSTTTTTTTDTALPTANKKARRDAAPSPPPCVTQGTYPASRITFACSCLYTQPTITVTPSAAATKITIFTTSSPVVTVTVYSTTTVPLTITTTSSTTTRTTTTTTTSAVSTSTATLGYTLVVGPHTGETCDYSYSYAGYYFTGDPGVNYINAEDSCRDSCSNDPPCEFFFIAADSATLCQLSSAHYDPQDLDCSSTGSSAYYIGYNKVLS